MGAVPFFLVFEQVLNPWSCLVTISLTAGVVDLYKTLKVTLAKVRHRKSNKELAGNKNIQGI
jgi:hypothetical protein